MANKIAPVSIDIDPTTYATEYRRILKAVALVASEELDGAVLRLEGDHRVLRIRRVDTLDAAGLEYRALEAEIGDRPRLRMPLADNGGKALAILSYATAPNPTK